MPRVSLPRLLTVALLVLATPTSPPALHAQTVAPAALQDLQGVDELKTMFNRDAGKVRMVLLLSPT